MIIFQKKLFLLFAIILVVSSFGLNLLLFDDEPLNATRADGLRQGIYPEVYGHPPGRFVNEYIYIFFSDFFELFGVDFPIRVIPLFYGMITLLLVFLFAKKVYGREVGFLAVAITGLSFYHIHASLSAELDGSLLTMLLTASIYLYYLFVLNGRKKYLFGAGLVFGLALWTKYTALIALPIILVFLIATGRINKKQAKCFAGFTLTGFALIALFPIYAFVFGIWDKFLFTLEWGATGVGGGGDKLLTVGKALFKYLYRIMQYGTPLLFFLPLAAFFRRERKDEWIFFSWLGTGLALLILVNSHGQLERYAMILIPAMGILSAKALMNCRELIKSNWRKLAVITAVFTALIVFLNMYSFTVQPFSLEFFDAGLVLLNPNVWYTGSSGPVFAVSLYSLAFTALVGTAGFAVFMFSKSEKRKRIGLLVLIGVSIPFNFFMVEEHFFYAKSPDYNKTIMDMVDFAEENNLPPPYFAVDVDVPFYLGSDNFYDLSDSTEREHLDDGGTVLFLNFPERRNPILWNDVIKNCSLLKTFTDKGFETGFVLELCA